ncbi:MAG: L,D-transpeptidase family protein [Candidatus Deferrimicrobiaceae bacterium]
MRNVLFVAMLAILAATSTPTHCAAGEYRRDGALVGARQAHVVGVDDSLYEVARDFDLGYAAITAANPGVDPFVPDPGTRIVLPTEWILPDVPIRRGIVINIAEMRLFLLPPRDWGTISSFPIGVGDEGTETPVGKFSIVDKIKNPPWHVPESIRKERPDLPAVVPPGPDNPLGSRALRLSNGTLLIHGTNRPWGIGTRNTHGCIRLYEEDIARLFGMVDNGTPVVVVNQPVKVAAEGDRVFLEVHDYVGGRNLYRETQKLLNAKGLADRIDPEKVRTVNRERSGLVVDVSKRQPARETVRSGRGASTASSPEPR